MEKTFRAGELVPLGELVRRAPRDPAADDLGRERLRRYVAEHAEELRGFAVFGRAEAAAGGDLRAAWPGAPPDVRAAWSVADVHGWCGPLAAAVTLLECARQHRRAEEGAPCGRCDVGRANARFLTLPTRPAPPPVSR